ncbi:MAG: copper amine oxidase N-terminal domain-containing protein [Thermoanaerobacteraceae bacterium]|nr:copper amine oxidase N-terminal domain-containing protein [Thermoanaerobacteraceae bacterium]
MLKKVLSTAFLSMALVMGTAGISEASVGSKTLNVHYNDVQLNVNGTPITTSPANEPFIIDGVTFVPLRIIAEALNCNVNWQVDTRTVVITSNNTAAEVTHLIQLVQEKEQEIQSLNQQIEQLKEELAAADEAASDLSDLEDALRDDYDYIGEVYIDDLELEGDEDEVTVDIWVDVDEYEDEWADLSNSEIEDWLEDLVADIQEELSKYTEVSGNIINSDNDDTLVEFSKDGTNSLEVDYLDEDYRENDEVDEALEELEDETYYVDNIEFTATDVRYDESSDKVTVYLTANTSSAGEDWEDLSSSTIEGEVQDICEDIVEVFADADIDLEQVRVYFYDADSNDLGSFTYDVDEETLD